MEKFSYLEPVTNGAKVLTDYFGNDSWKGRIDPDTLVMSSPCRCILGQLFKDYWKGLLILGIEPNAGAVPLGFDVAFGDGSYYDLALTWKGFLGAKEKE